MRMLNCDLDHFRQAPRITKSDKDNRDLLIFTVWKTGLLANEEIGRLFGMTYSSVSHIVSSIGLRIKESRELKEKSNQINSLYNGLLPKSFFAGYETFFYKSKVRSRRFQNSPFGLKQLESHFFHFAKIYE